MPFLQPGYVVSSTGSIIYKAPTNTNTTTTTTTVQPSTTTQVSSFYDQLAYIQSLQNAYKAPTSPTAATNYDIFKAELAVVFGTFGANDEAWLKEIFNAGKKRMADGISASSIPDLLLQDTSLVNYRNRFKGLIALQERAKTQKVAYLPTIAEYIQAERTNTLILQRYGLNNLANQNTLDALFAGDVSATELEERITTGYLAIQNADAALKQQLAAEFPTLNQADFLEALLSGSDGAKVLQQKVLRAGINAEAATAGLTSQIGAEELRKSGVTRESARTGFQQVAMQKAGTEQAGRIFGDVEVGTLQTELEKESLLGQTSKRAKGLQSQARAQFGGSAGVITGSLTKKKQV